MKLSRKKYKDWAYSVKEYNRLHKTNRQEYMLEYFRECGAIEAEDVELNKEVMLKIMEDTVISCPDLFGQKQNQHEKHFPSLRKCFWSELVFVFSNELPDEAIVIRKSNPEEEEKRLDEYMKLLANHTPGDIFLKIKTTHARMTPVSNYRKNKHLTSRTTNQANLNAIPHRVSDASSISLFGASSNEHDEISNALASLTIHDTSQEYQSHIIGSSSYERNAIDINVTSSDEIELTLNGYEMETETSNDDIDSTSMEANLVVVDESSDNANAIDIDETSSDEIELTLNASERETETSYDYIDSASIEENLVVDESSVNVIELIVRRNERETDAGSPIERDLIVNDVWDSKPNLCISCEHNNREIYVKCCIADNARRFFRSELFQAKGRRKQKEQQLVDTAWAVVHTDRNKTGVSADRVLNFMQCGNRPLLHRAQKSVRNNVLSGKDAVFPFYSKRWNDFNESFKDMMFNFCHDPDYTKPDNNDKHSYTCFDESWNKVQHKRKNWVMDGSIEDQYQECLLSSHFTRMVQNLQRQFAHKEEMKDFDCAEKYVRTKFTIKKFIYFKSNCVKEILHHSCVDDIIARAHDYSMALSRFSRGLISSGEQRMDPALRMPSSIVDSPHDDDYSRVVDMDDNGSVEDDTDFNDEDAQASLYDDFMDCDCPSCKNGNSLLHIFSSLKGNPHIALKKLVLCEASLHPDLTPSGSQVFSLHKYECSEHKCKECGVDKRIPWDCPMATCDRKIPVWIWKKDASNQSVCEKEKRKFSEVLTLLRDAMKRFITHDFWLQLLGQQRKLRLINLQSNSVVILTDFSAQMDLIPKQKVTNHINTHASLSIFILYFKNSIEVESETIQYTECFEFFIFGECEGKGKQNDWVFHNSSLDYILKYMGNEFPHLKEWHLFTDNSPYQYKCRQNIFQVAKLTTKHENVQKYSHNFARIHGFKGKPDTAGHYIKFGIKSEERKQDDFAKDAKQCAEFADQYCKNNPSNFERLLGNPNESLKQALKDKTPHECTRRIVMYIVEKKDRFEDLKRQEPEKHFIYCDREKLQQEDTQAIEDTKQYYCFSHSREDDAIPTIDDFPEVRPSVGHEAICRFCHSEFQKNGLSYERHESRCRVKHLSGVGRKIRFKVFDCFCNQCNPNIPDNGPCQYSLISGEEKFKWLLSTHDEQRLDDELNAESAATANHQLDEAVRSIIERFRTSSEALRTREMNTGQYGLKAKDWKNLTKKFIKEKIARRDGKSGEPTIHDNLCALNQLGGWDYVLSNFNE